MAITITIDDQDLDEIYFETGVPVIDKEDVEVPVDNVKKVCVFPAMMEYFAWFPLTLVSEYDVSNSSFSVDFPTQNTFGITDARIILSSGQGSAGSPFVNSLIYKRASSGGYGRSGQYGYAMYEAKLLERQFQQANMNLNVTKQLTANSRTRKLTGFISSVGTLKVTWAEISYTFSDIPMRDRLDVKDLAKSKLLRAVGMIRAQQQNTMDMEMNYQQFLDRAQALEEKVLEKWRGKTKVVVLRS